MLARFLLGPAGSGKTFRCLAEIRAELKQRPEGPPLVLLAPKQATFQLERQLLADRRLPGYVRLHILSFERLARFVFGALNLPWPNLLAEEGRVMVLRALLAQHQQELEVFRASARLPGLAQELSTLLRELQQHHLTPTRLDHLARQAPLGPVLGRKLRDLARLLRAYAAWLQTQGLQDADNLLSLAEGALQPAARQPSGQFRLGGLWLDGFAQMTPQERRLLASLVACSEQATLAFCLDAEPTDEIPWHSPWALIGQTYRLCRAELASLPGIQVVVEVIPRQPERSRLAAQPLLQHLERHWSQPVPFTIQGAEVALRHAEPEVGCCPPGCSEAAARMAAPQKLEAVRLVRCPDPEGEALFAAREILRFVREQGGRFRDVAVLVRQLEVYHDPLRRALTRLGVPFFLDRREPIAHHPLAELTRAALRTLALGWQTPDWLAALKTGLVPASDREVDELENEALAQGWTGEQWKQPLRAGGEAAPAQRLETLRARLVAPFVGLEKALGSAPTGPQLAEGLAVFWDALQVPRRLEDWASRRLALSDVRFTRALHATAWTQMQAWLENLALAFPAQTLPLREWLPIVEAGLARLTVGVVPPALDQVLVGAIDRSRNPELRCVFVLGLNETVFPAAPPPGGLLTDAERAQLAAHHHGLGPDRRLQLGHERFYGYIACTRARERLVLTFARRSADGQELNPSLFVEHLRRLFPSLAVESFDGLSDPADAQHPTELEAPLALWQQRHRLASPGQAGAAPQTPWARLAAMPSFAPLLAQAAQWAEADAASLSAEAVDRAYGRELLVSVSALENFAACPFKFFVQRGLEAGERQRFEVDPREKGSFQHAVLRAFQEHLAQAGQRWRDLTPDQARQLVRTLGQAHLERFREGLFASDEGRRFVAGLLIEGLEQLIAELVRWNREQYDFDPRFAELEFGPGQRLPGWRITVDEQHALVLRGRLDRVDLCQPAEAPGALAVVVDYKSGEEKFDLRRFQNGLQLQLLAYAAVLRHLPDPFTALGVPAVQPVGVFYVSLRQAAPSAKTRAEALAEAPANRVVPYQHQGRFDARWLRRFDRRPDAERGDQFRYGLNRTGTLHARGDALPTDKFEALLLEVEAQVRRIGRQIFAGQVAPAPYRSGSETACGQCLYRGICRFDPWVQPYRKLNSASASQEA